MKEIRNRTKCTNCKLPIRHWTKRNAQEALHHHCRFDINSLEENKICSKMATTSINKHTKARSQFPFQLNL